jgi:hypothetical protein
MSDLINNNNNINSDNEIIAPQSQTLLSTLANIVKNNERESMKSYKGSSRNDKFVNKEWTTNTSAVLAT